MCRPQSGKAADEYKEENRTAGEHAPPVHYKPHPKRLVRADCRFTAHSETPVTKKVSRYFFT
jgi:hypothetical protein